MIAGDLCRMESLADEVGLACGVEYRNLIDARFVKLSLDRGLGHVRGDGWITASHIADAPGEVLARASYFHAAQDECLLEIDDALVHLILSDRSLVIRVAAPEDTAIETALLTMRAAMPEAVGAEKEAPVRFWWWQPHFAQEMARFIPTPAWTEIESNYASSTATILGQVMTWRGGPPPGGRLLLWHGAPGTGKTTAARSLAWEWRDWVEFQFITDPEEFLRNPSYLLRTISDDRRSSMPTSPVDRWRVLVLEDAGEYLAPDAKHVAGQALSRLLNVCDGVLGQATRSLVLVTTNEPLRSLHPALSRPGRCLSEIEFARLSRAEIELWCASRSTPPPATSGASLAELFALLEGRPTSAIRHGAVGFAPTV